MLEKLEQWLSTGGNFLWAGQLFLFVMCTLIVDFVEARFYSRCIDHFKRTQSLWDDALIFAMHKPLKGCIWIVGLTLIGQTMTGHIEHAGNIFPWVAQARLLAIIAMLVWFMFRFINKLESNAVTPMPGRKTVPPETAQAIAKLCRIVISFMMALIVLSSVGVNITGFLTFGSVGTIVVGLAGQTLLSNFFGGLMLYLDRPFSVGDWVRSPDREIEGFVEDIGWRLTKIRTFSKRPLYIPNSVFNTISLENPSRMSNRQIKENIGVRYNDAAILPDILKEINELLNNHPEIDANKIIMAHFVHFGPSSLDIALYCFTKTTNWKEFRNVQEQIFMDIMKIIKKHGGECAFPTQTLHVPDGVKVVTQPEVVGV